MRLGLAVKVTKRYSHVAVTVTTINEHENICFVELFLIFNSASSAHACKTNQQQQHSTPVHTHTQRNESFIC